MFHGQEWSYLIMWNNLLDRWTHLEGKEYGCRVGTAVFINHSELKSNFLSHKNDQFVVCKEVFVSKNNCLCDQQVFGNLFELKAHNHQRHVACKNMECKFGSYLVVYWKTQFSRIRLNHWRITELCLFIC